MCKSDLSSRAGTEQASRTPFQVGRIAVRARILYIGIPSLAVGIILILGSIISRDIAHDSSRRLARQYSIEAAANFLVGANPHFVLMQQISRSTTISRWLAHEFDREIRDLAFDEIMGYTVFAPNAYVMFTVNETWHGYNFTADLTPESFTSWGRLSGGEASQWFFDTRDAEIPFILNVQRTRPDDYGHWYLYLWSNHRMYYRSRFVGVVTVGTSFEDIFDATFGDFDINSKRGYVIDRNAAVRTDSALELKVLREGLPIFPALPEASDNPSLRDGIDGHLQRITGGIFPIGADTLAPIPLSSGRFRYASITPIIGTDWSVVVLSTHQGIFGGARYMPLVFSTIAVLILSVLLGSLLVRRGVLTPLSRLTQSVADASGTAVTTDLFGLEREDEIGYLARTVQSARDNQNSINDKLKENERVITQSRQMLIYRENLLKTVNQAAEVLLTADEENTLRALLRGMAILGRCLDSDRVQIWRNEIIDGELHFVMKYQWLSELGKEKAEVPIGLNFPYREKPHWLEMFMRGDYMNTPISQLPPEDRDLLVRYDIISILNLPLFLDQEYIGFFSIDDCRQERVFKDDEIDIIASAGLMFTSVLNRNVQAEKIAVANKQVESALMRALSASRAKSNFLSTMSHEMRTPMNAIIGMTAIAKNEKNNEQKNRALKKVEKAARHLLGIINDVLDMSKIEANRLALHHTEFDLRHLLQKAASLVEFPLEEKQHRFSVNLDDNVPFFYIGDDQRLTQILTNLLSNAVTYTPAGGEISLDVSLTKQENERCDLRFAVSDNGIGISEENQKRLFNMFEQGDESTTRKYGGTGLGLAITKRLIELMDGAISVTSELGKGSRFTFTIRLTHVESIQKDPQTGSASEDADPFNDESDDSPTLVEDIKFPGKRLLIAEDLEINREVLITQLDGTGIEIDIAQNGKEALEKITANPRSYDLVFMDVQMPEMDGLEATRLIRSLPASSAGNLPIIAMTANVFAEDIQQCLAAGMDDHIGKPLDIRIVFEKLYNYL